MEMLKGNKRIFRYVIYLSLEQARDVSRMKKVKEQDLITNSRFIKRILLKQLDEFKKEREKQIEELQKQVQNDKEQSCKQESQIFSLQNQLKFHKDLLAEQESYLFKGKIK